VSRVLIQNYMNSITLHLLWKWILVATHVVLCQANDSCQITRGLLNRDLKQNPECVWSDTQQFHRERHSLTCSFWSFISWAGQRQQRSPSQTYCFLFPQPLQWLACISYRHLFSFLINWQRIWAALREEEELWSSFQIFWFWCNQRMTDERGEKSQNSPIMAKS